MLKPRGWTLRVFWLAVAATTGPAWLAVAATTGPAWAADAPWQPVECMPADLPAEELFDVVQQVDGFEDPKPKWILAVGGQHAQATVQHDLAEHHGGDGSLRVEYDFVGKREHEYIQLNGQTEFAKPGLGFGFWLKHDGAPFVVRLRFIDASGEWHQIDMFHV